jgi:hypothetical protein
VTWHILVSGKKCAISALPDREAAGFHKNLMINEVLLDSLIFSRVAKNGAFVIAVRKMTRMDSSKIRRPQSAILRHAIAPQGSQNDLDLEAVGSSSVETNMCFSRVAL